MVGLGFQRIIKILLQSDFEMRQDSFVLTRGAQLMSHGGPEFLCEFKGPNSHVLTHTKDIF